MKLRSIPFALAALACTCALAQAPAGVAPRPSQQQNPNASGGMPQAKAEAKNDAQVAAGMGNKAMPGAKPMDTNGDGMISKKEWEAYHSGMWSGMKADKRGMVPWADVEARMKGGPN